jgi:long-subunit fatty acid transport protein
MSPRATIGSGFPTFFFTGLLIAFTPTSIAAQVLTTVEFSFSNPGARSMGLGGAFVALADDATAAFANPAGLTQLTKPEVSMEGRYWNYTSRYTSGGRAAGEPTGIGIDTVGAPLRGESTADLTGLSFVSLVYPMDKWSLAFFRHQPLNFEQTQEIQGLFAPGSGFAGTQRGPIEKGFFDFEFTTHALAAGYRVSDRLSLGFGISYIDSSSSFFGDEYLPDNDTLDGYFSAASFLPERLSHHFVAEISEGDSALVAGFLLRVSRNWKLGGVYREGAELEFEVTLTAGPAHPNLPSGQQVVTGFSPWNFPDVYGLGLSFRSPDGHWATGFEWTHVQYSTLIDSLSPEFTSPGDTLDDANELHLGGEYAFFVGTSVVAVRMGAWHDPDHQVRNEAGEPFIQAELIPGKDQLHFTAGIGAAFNSIQIDVGVDLSEHRETASLSAIYSF